ncbi:hypothetical protein HKX48_008053 [Thoreauomyces humboldtii]|nr:hypothetical protein HKX48_008053 [Thoreauomyces humboldtii]
MWEAEIQAITSQLAPLQTFDSTCYGYLMQFLCSSLPACVGGTPVLPCESTCTFAATACTRTLTALGQQALIPQCSGGIATASGMIPYPTSQCIGGTSGTTPLSVLATETTSMVYIKPATAFVDGVSTEQITMLVLYVISLFGFLDLILAFARLRRSYSLLAWGVVWVLIIAVTFAGQIMYQFDIRRSFGTDFCRRQALVLVYLNQTSWILPFFFTYDVWHAVVRKKLRGGSELERFLWNTPAFILPIIPTVIIALKANPTGFTAPDNLQPGFGPHVLFCSFLYPVKTWGESTLPWIALFGILSIFFGTHASYRLYVQRRAFNSSGKNSSNPLSSNGESTQRQSRRQSKISIVIFVRILSVSLAYLLLAIVLNYQQVRAALRGEYAPDDERAGVRDFAAASIGIFGWLVLCTSSATWEKTIAGSLALLACGRKKRQLDTTTARNTKSRAAKVKSNADAIELAQHSYHNPKSYGNVENISGPYNVTHDQATFSRPDSADSDVEYDGTRHRRQPSDSTYGGSDWDPRGTRRNYSSDSTESLVNLPARQEHYGRDSRYEPDGSRSSILAMPAIGTWQDGTFRVDSTSPAPPQQAYGYDRSEGYGAYKGRLPASVVSGGQRVNTGQPSDLTARGQLW